MTTTTNAKQVKMNIMTQAQYDTITPSPTELYVLTDADVITVDSALSSSSTNPVQNKVINTALNSKQDSSTAVTHTASTAVGNSTTPVYINSSGVATALSFTIAKSVPSDAVFTDTTYSTFTGATSIAGGSSGLVPTPSSGDNDKILTGDASWSGLKTVNSTSLLGSGDIATLVNNATGTNSLSILGGNISAGYSVCIGKSAYINAENGVSIGYNSAVGVSATKGTAIGYNAVVAGSASNSIQLGYGTNSMANTFSVGFSGYNNYNLLDGTTGLIPDARISTNIQRTLVSGTSIKTINNTSILGSGNINVAPVITYDSTTQTLTFS